MTNPFDPNDFPNCFRGHDYALKIIGGEIPSSKYVLGACKRYLKDLADEENPVFYFDAEKAEKFLRLAQRFDHIIGEWKTPKIIYEPWQCWVWMNIMGFLSHETGYRRFRVAHLEVGRGNGKSPMASIAGLYFLCLDNPKGNQISTAATKKEQARIVLDSSRNMARGNGSFLKRTGTRVLAHSIIHEKSNSIMRALSSESSGLDGLNDILAILDELHAMRRDTFDVISSGMSKRKDSLMLCITTAGNEIDSVGYSQSEYAKKICLGEHLDDSFFAAVYCAEPHESLFDENVWLKANPNLDISVDRSSLRAKAEKAKVSPADIHNFEIKHLNIWRAGMNAYFDPTYWDRCADPTLKIEDFSKQTCTAAFDLASTRDLTTTCYVFKDKEEKFNIFFDNYIPEDRLEVTKRIIFDEAVARGHLIKTPGAAINNDQIRLDIEAKQKMFKIDECAFDPWNAKEMSQTLSKKIEMVKFPMNVANFSEPMKRLDTLMREGNIRHQGWPIIRWALTNVVAKYDANSNVFPRKNHEDLKIDPIVAMLMALALWLQEPKRGSIYSERGIRTV